MDCCWWCPKCGSSYMIEVVTPEQWCRDAMKIAKSHSCIQRTTQSGEQK